MVRVDVHRDQLGRIRTEVRLPRRRGHVAVAGEVAVVFRDVGEGVVDGTPQADSDLVPPALDRKVGEAIRRDDVPVARPPAGDRDGNDRLGVVRPSLADSQGYCAAFRSERRSWASPRYACFGVWSAGA
jgi:hypothetical protein